MNIHEYQSKQVLREFGVNVPNGLPAFTVDEAVANAEKLGSPVIVVKAQIMRAAAARRAVSRSQRT